MAIPEIISKSVESSFILSLHLVLRKFFAGMVFYFLKNIRLYFLIFVNITYFLTLSPFRMLQQYFISYMKQFLC